MKHRSAGGFIFFIDSKNKLFVALLRDGDNKWVIPKGHIKEGEEPQETALREIREELSLDEDPEIVSFLSVSNYEFQLEDGSEHKKQVHMYVFKADRKFKIKPNKDEGLKSAKWFLFEDALEKISFDRDNLKKAKNVLMKEVFS